MNSMNEWWGLKKATNDKSEIIFNKEWEEWECPFTVHYKIYW